VKTLKSVLSSILLIGPSLAFAQPVAQGTFNLYTYIAVEAPNGITWTAAEADAVAMGGQLASITSAPEDQFIYSLISSVPSLWAREGGNPSGAGIGLGWVVTDSQLNPEARFSGMMVRFSVTQIGQVGNRMTSVGMRIILSFTLAPVR
jgi:hypothetical protein